MRTRLSLFNNKGYSHKSGLFKRFFWVIIEFFFLKNPLFFLSSWKVFVLRMFGAQIGYGVVIKPSVSIKHPWMLEVGNDVWIGEGVWIDNLVQVKIGNDVCLSQGAMLLTGNHNYTKPSFDLMAGDIIIEDGSWVGAKGVVCPGVTLYSHSVLCAGSVATWDLLPYSINQGNPACYKKKRYITLD